MPRIFDNIDLYVASAAECLLFTADISGAMGIP